MVDSSVGGKVAVNLSKYKNAIGCFYQPTHVLIDISFLETLPKQEILSGYAEVFKYGLIYDKDFYNYLINNEQTLVNFTNATNIDEQTQNYLTYIISQSCKIKAEIVSQDEFETKNLREILNFGHTFGHAFEGLYLGEIPHGFAVAIGMIYALKYSKIETTIIEKHYKNIGLYTNIETFCNENNLPIPTPIEILKLMVKDKKNTANTASVSYTHLTLPTKRIV